MFLPGMTTRTKWAIEDERAVPVVHMVWVSDKQYYPFNQMGRILQLHTGNDGISRLARVKTDHEKVQNITFQL